MKAGRALAWTLLLTAEGIAGSACKAGPAATNAPSANLAKGHEAPLPPTGPRALAAGDATVVADEATLARLIAAPDGPRRIELAPGQYRGDVEIKRPLQLSGQLGAELVGSGRHSVVTITANDVVLENLRITHSGRRNTAEDAGVKATGERITIRKLSVADSLFGVSMLACHDCLLEDTELHGADGDEELRGDGIKLWESHRSAVRRCFVEKFRDIVVWYTRNALLEDNVVRHSRYGTHFMYAHDAIVRRSHVDSNIVGIFVMYSMRMRLEDNVLRGARGAAGMGLGFKDSDAIVATGNRIEGNSTGVYLDDTPRTPSQPAIFSKNLFAHNELGLRLLAPQGGLQLTDNAFVEERSLLEVDGGSDATAVTFEGNYYSDYDGYDLDGDGIGDVAYAPKRLDNDLLDAHPALQFFSGTAAWASMQTVARAVPLFAAQTLFSDAHPRMELPGLAGGAQ